MRRERWIHSWEAKGQAGQKWGRGKKGMASRGAKRQANVGGEGWPPSLRHLWDGPVEGSGELDTKTERSAPGW